MRPQTRTKVSLLALGILALGLEGGGAIWGEHSLISEVLWGIEDPLVWVAVGVLLGHLAWQSRVVYAWTRGEVDYVKRGGLERYRELRGMEDLTEEGAEQVLIVEGYLDRYKGRA